MQSPDNQMDLFTQPLYQALSEYQGMRIDPASNSAYFTGHGQKEPFVRSIIGGDESLLVSKVFDDSGSELTRLLVPTSDHVQVELYSGDIVHLYESVE